MLSRIDLRGTALSGLDARGLRNTLPRAEFDVEAALDAVRPICEQVEHGGVEALLELGEKFDGVRPPQLRVPAEVITAALETLDPAVRAALEESIRRARLVHADQRRTEVTTKVSDGGTVTEKWIPVDRVGLYVPGGKAVYPSSVVMNVVPAQLAEVGSIAVASPPQKDNGGYPHPTILAACALLDVDEVYAVGGAQAVAMFAHGARDASGVTVCEPATLVTGPGNIYVAAAKRLLKGLIGIDAEAGPTEIAILADATAQPDLVAADLISQAEHDELAASVLVTDSVERADAVIAVSPTFKASYSGLFKTFVDLLDDEALVGVPVLLGATGGTARHSLMIDQAMRPLFAYLKTRIVPTAVFAASDDWGSATGQPDSTRATPLAARIRAAGAELADTLSRLPARPRAAAVDATDTLEVIPFDRLLDPHA